MKIDGKIQGICLQEIQFQEDGNFSEVQLMRTGKFMHPFMDDFEITEDMFKSFKKNFDQNVKKVRLAIDFSHNSHLEAAGWITSISLKEDDTELWLAVEWTDHARRKIMDKEFRYMSADFNTKFVDNETGKDFGPTLNGAALTNRPFIKDMQAVLSELDIDDLKRQAINKILNENMEEESQMTPEEIKTHIATLSDAEKREMGLIEEVTLSDDEAKDKATKLEAENKTLSETLGKERKDREFSVMLSEGKAVEAQRVSFMKGDMSEFVKLSVSLNTKSDGSGEEPEKKDKNEDSGPQTFDEAQDKIVELADARMKENKALSVGDAHKQILSENPKLEKLMEAG